MELTIGGARGSYTASRPAFNTFGGHTTSYLVRGSQGTAVLVDAGSGIRLISEALAKDAGMERVYIFLTHYHLDHIAGLPTLPMLYKPGIQIDVVGPSLEGVDCEEAVSPVLSHPYWPFNENKKYPANLVFKTLPAERSIEPIACNELTLQWCPVQHPGGCVAYRIDEPGTSQSLVVATDVEWQASSKEQKNDFYKLCSGSDPVGLLVFDGHYSREEYAERKGWGHSTWLDAVEVARNIKAGKLLVTHHGPEKDDKALSLLEADLQEEMPGAHLARQAGHIEIP